MWQCDYYPKTMKLGDLFLEIAKSVLHFNLLIRACLFQFYHKHSKNLILIQNMYTFNPFMTEVPII